MLHLLGPAIQRILHLFLPTMHLHFAAFTSDASVFLCLSQYQFVWNELSQHGVSRRNGGVKRSFPLYIFDLPKEFLIRFFNILCSMMDICQKKLIIKETRTWRIFAIYRIGYLSSIVIYIQSNQRQQREGCDDDMLFKSQSSWKDILFIANAWSL